MEDPEVFLKKLHHYAVQLYLSEVKGNEDETKALLVSEQSFKDAVNAFEPYLNNDPRKDFLLFVANRQNYSLKERVRIGQQFINEMDNL